MFNGYVFICLSKVIQFLIINIIYCYFNLSLYGDLKGELNTMIRLVGGNYRKYKIQNNVSDVNKNVSNVEYLYVFS